MTLSIVVRTRVRRASTLLCCSTSTTVLMMLEGKDTAQSLHHDLQSSMIEHFKHCVAPGLVMQVAPCASLLRQHFKALVELIVHWSLEASLPDVTRYASQPPCILIASTYRAHLSQSPPQEAVEASPSMTAHLEVASLVQASACVHTGELFPCVVQSAGLCKEHPPAAAGRRAGSRRRT